MKALTVKKFSYTRRVKISQPLDKTLVRGLFVMKVVLGASVFCVYRVSKPFLYPKSMDEFNFHRPRVVLVRNRNFKMPVNMVESILDSFV